MQSNKTMKTILLILLTATSSFALEGTPASDLNEYYTLRKNMREASPFERGPNGTFVLKPAAAVFIINPNPSPTPRPLWK